MRKKYRSWIPGIVFWVLFLVSIGLARRYRWLDPIWNVAWIALLIVIATWSVVETFRKRDKAGGYVGYRGIPRWVVRLFGGEAN